MLKRKIKEYIPNFLKSKKKKPTIRKHSENPKINVLDDVIKDKKYKELIHKFELNPKGMTPKEQELLIKLRQTIYDEIGQKITKRTYGFVHHFAVKLLEKYKRADPITLNQHLFEMYPKTIQIDQHFWFKWTFDSKTGTIHLFEYNNQFGLDSKHPKYIELKEAAISKIKKLSKIYVNSKAIVDSEIIDK